MVAPRIALVVEYDGTDFHGWQVQPTDRSVQGDLERALARVADAPVATICAGRTDAGVHAIAQVVHFDPPAGRTQEAWTLGVNAQLRDDVRVVAAFPVSDEFHARFGALARRYRYLILNRPLKSALHRHRALHIRQPLDVAAMSTAAQVLVGEHDFSAFRAASCQAPHPVRTVHALEVNASGAWITIDIVANAFLQNMVRIVVGSLLRVGRAEADAAWLADVLAGRDRRHDGVTVSPHGLYLAGVRYEPRFAVDTEPDAGALLPSSSTIMAP